METKTFNEIKEYINENAKSKDTLWLFGERKWTIERNMEILKKESDNKLPLANAETGIFLTKEISNLDDFKDCARLVFFNSEEQFQFIAVDNSSSEYLFYHSQITWKKIEPLRTIMDKDEGNYRFQFANKLGAIPDIQMKVEIIVDEEKEEWRLWHE